MKTTSRAEASLKSLSETVLPAVSRSLKSGAGVPSGNIVEFTATMREIWNGPSGLSNANYARSTIQPQPRMLFLTFRLSIALCGEVRKRKSSGDGPGGLGLENPRVGVDNRITGTYLSF